MSTDTDYDDVIDALTYDDDGYIERAGYDEALREVLARPEPAIDVILKRRTAHARRAEKSATKRWLRGLR